MNNKKHITTAIFVVVMLFIGISSCKEKKQQVVDIDLSVNRKQMPSIRTRSVLTLVSDSGVTRYRLTAPLECLYDKADTPYLEFPEGVQLERFDTDLKVDANIRANYAKYFTEKEFWELIGSVDATNLDGNRFETERLYWDQKKEKIYSDTLIKITEKNNTIYGTNFVSDQTLSRYTIKESTGDFTIDEE